MKQKVVIIGSGMGGLSCGVILAKNGYQVSVLEQDTQLGGCLQCFTRKGAKFETGMHFIGSASKGQTLYRLLKYLGVMDRVKLSQLNPDAYEVVSINGSRHSFATGRERFVETLANDFPGQRCNLETLCDIIEQVASASSLHSLKHTETDEALNPEYQLQTIDEVVDKVITDPLLAKVLVGNLPLFAAEKGKTPFSTYAFVMDFYNQSAYRIVGGSDAIANALVEELLQLGGKVYTRHKVVSIDCDDTHATGVTCADGTSFDADYVICDTHPARMIEMVKSPLLRPAYRHRVEALRNTVGGFSVYLRFKPGSLHYMNCNFYGYHQGTPWGCENYTDANWPMGYLYMHFCSEEQQEWAESGVILSYMRMEEVERWKGTRVGHRGEDYEAFKRDRAERLIDALEQDMPGIRRHIAEYYTSTPLTYLDYTGTEGGSMYGIAKDVTMGPAARIHHRTKIPNLLLTGQNINSHGILGVLVGTMVTCGELITSEEIFRQIVHGQ